MKQFVVIGCGRFGGSVAKSLSKLGHDVLAIDKDEKIVQNISEHVTHAVQSSGTDEQALHSLGIKNFDVAIISIGTDIQTSILSTLIAKEAGINYIVAKAQGNLHAKVLYKIGADRVVFPEREMGERVAHNLVAHNIIDYIELSKEYSIMELEVPKNWVGKSLIDLDLRVKHGINVMAIKHDEEINISPEADDELDHDDILVVIGHVKDLGKIQDL
ncbi:potassium channel family protein [Isachenkonia alkalipeptolytica]|uniref:TrkA family potassium uptake protein n=1 Tax=Isachenkonia alkalipeptolytica TaxID=2565777 RepID=A0AA43XLG1_9CLOT|nr:TrkA family potassium uptake protein [Isachenkonia alkalipeptolytica]NBG88576.1 TrkA family potassium uptake protein [Isachenkonia alkalipeptolytica]